MPHAVDYLQIQLLTPNYSTKIAVRNVIHHTFKVIQSDYFLITFLMTFDINHLSHSFEYDKLVPY